MNFYMQKIASIKKLQSCILFRPRKNLAQKSVRRLENVNIPRRRKILIDFAKITAGVNFELERTQGAGIWCRRFHWQPPCR